MQKQTVKYKLAIVFKDEAIMRKVSARVPYPSVAIAGLRFRLMIHFAVNAGIQ